MRFKPFLLLVFFTVILIACSTRIPSPKDTTGVLPTGLPENKTTRPPTSTSVINTPTVGPSEEMPTPTPQLTVISPELSYGPTNFPANINPLTGLPIQDLNVLKRRPIAVKINIIPRMVRPPIGLSLADIVYEFYHNDGYARFHAIYYGNDAELVGPIRSARLFDDPLIRMYKSIFVYGRADERIERRLYSSEYKNRLIVENEVQLCPPSPENPLCRQEPNGYDLLLTNTSDVHVFVTKKGVDDSQQNLDGMFFQVNPPVASTTAGKITTHYSGDSYNRWEYDAKTGKYLRFQDNIYDQGTGEVYAPLIDRLDQQKIVADNVVVLFMPHTYYVPPPGEIVEIVLNSSGKAYAFRDGQVYLVNWNHPAADRVIYLTFPDGNLYPFKPGNTWFEVVGESSDITQPEKDAWRFDSKFP